MLKPAQMAELRTVVPQEKREPVVRALHEVGEVQLESVNEKLVSKLDLEKESAPPELGEISSLTMKINRILETFEKPPSPTPSQKEKMKGLWNTYFKPTYTEKREIEVESREEALEIGKETVEEVESKITDLDTRLENSKNEIAELKEKIRNLKLLENFDFESLKVLKFSEFTFVKAGTISEENVGDFENSLREKIGNKFVLLTRPVSGERKIICVWTLSEDKDEVKEALSYHGFNDLDLPRLRGKPKKVRKKLEKKLREEKKEKENCFQKIRTLSQKHKKELLAVREILNIEKERAGAVNNFSRTETVTVIQGWVPKDGADQVKEVIHESAEGMSHTKISNPGNPKGDPPTLLKNPPVLEKFEVLTELFGLPGEGEIDPTPLLAFTYVLFFGIMLTDVAYGAILLLVSIGLLYGAGRTNESIKNFSTILVLGSLAAIFTGLITGSFFGDLLTEYVGLGKWGLYNPIENPVPLLLFSLSIGIFHEYLAASIGLWEEIRKGQWKDAIGDRLSWLLLVPGSVILISYGFGWVSFDSPTLIIGGALTTASFVIIIFTQGPLGIMEVFSMLGNIISYTRILALTLVTGALAITFNAIVGMVWGLPLGLGIIIGAVLFLGTQLFSLIINIISSFVHSLRLHYVEFFDKFYRGEGTKFKAFRVERTHTRG